MKIQLIFLKTVLTGMINLAVICLLPTQAMAHSFSSVLLISPIIFSSSIIPAAGSTCAVFTYDKNGNRVTQTTAAVPTTATKWGAGNYGCFVWHS